MRALGALVTLGMIFVLGLPAFAGSVSVPVVVTTDCEADTVQVAVSISDSNHYVVISDGDGFSVRIDGPTNEVVGFHTGRYSWAAFGVDTNGDVWEKDRGSFASESCDEPTTSTTVKDKESTTTTVKDKESTTTTIKDGKPTTTTTVGDKHSTTTTLAPDLTTTSTTVAESTTTTVEPSSSTTEPPAVLPTEVTAPPTTDVPVAGQPDPEPPEPTDEPPVVSADTLPFTGTFDTVSESIGLVVSASGLVLMGLVALMSSDLRRRRLE